MLKKHGEMLVKKTSMSRKALCGDLKLLIPVFVIMMLVSTVLLVNHAQAAIAFGPAINYGAGWDPRALISGDFNSDGKADIAAANYNSDNVSILLGNGDGSFQAAINYSVGLRPRFIVSGDFNHDGKVDIVVANSYYSSSTISVLLGNGDGTFKPAVNYSAGGAPSSVAVGDFNNDGNQDLAVTNYNDNNVTIFKGNGDGTFLWQSNYAVGATPSAVSAGDFNGDGKQDLAVTNINSNNISILKGNGDGTFQPAVNYGTQNKPNSVTVQDFNRDGKLDLSVANFYSGSVSILIGNGDGTFKAAVHYWIGSYPSWVTSNDLDGDGIPDLVVARDSSSTGVTVMIGKGDGTFSSWQSFNTYAYAVTTGDFNGDGKADIAAGCYAGASVSVLLNNTPFESSGIFNSAVTYGAGNNPHSIVGRDLNRDGKTDFAVANTDSHTVSILLGNGNGTFQTAVNYGTGANPKSVFLEDFNGDGNVDLATANAGGNTVSVRLGNSDATFGPLVDYGVGTTPNDLTVGDFNGDGVIDLAVANWDSAGVSVLMGNGNGSFKEKVDYITGVQPSSVIGGDFNRDGKYDLAVTNNGNNNISILIGNGDGTFLTATDYPTGTQPYSVTAADFNHDGKIDLVSANNLGSSISILIGNGDGTFQPAVHYGDEINALFVVHGDFNRDGKQDLAVGGAAQTSIHIMFGNGDGSFQTAVNYGVNGIPISITTGDFDGDGKIDLAAANNGFEHISVLLNKDSIPNQFYFNDLSDAALNKWVSSSAITVMGINTAVNISITGGEYSVSTDGGTTWSAYSTTVPGTANPNDRVKIRQLSSSSFSTKTDAVLTIGGVSDTFSITTRAADTTPDPFTFIDQTGVALNTTVVSNSITVTGIEVAVAISITGGEYSVNGGVYTAAAGTANNGDTVTVRQTSSPNYSATTNAVLTIGGVIDTFSITTLSVDTTPDPFTFIDQTGVALNTTVASNSITVTGIEVAVAISITGGEYSVNSGVYTAAAGTVNNGDTVTVRQTSSPNYSATTNAVLTIGGISDTFSITTVAGASNPFFDDLESGTQKWESSTGLWHVVSSTSAYPNSHSPTNSWWYGKDATGNYNTGATNNGEIVSTTFTVSSNAKLTFWSWEQTESSGTTYDTRKVYITTNGGTTWTQIFQSTDNAATWRQVTVDLAAYSGMTVKIKFAFNTVDGVANTYRGWYVDDITVATTTTPPPSGNTKNEGFETGTLTYLPWITSGNGLWSVKTTTKHSGTYAAEAPVSIIDNQSASLEVTQNCAAGSITFWYSVSSETNWDYLKFYVDGVQKGQWSGSVPWTQASYVVTTGTHTFKWVYSKDSSVSTGSDTAWIDDIAIPIP